MVPVSLASLNPAPAGASRKRQHRRDTVASGRQVIATEAEALRRLAEEIDQSFIDAVDLLAAVTGRVCVTGMGKSGHIARKIASTMASTGTPALYVHPAEASHGDLGMITQQDAVVALSNSGETSELRDLILYTRRFSIPLLAIVGRESSTLADAADVSLGPAERARGLPDGSGAHHLHDLHAGAGRRARGRRCSSGAASRLATSPCFIPAASWAASSLRVEELMHKGDDLPLVAPTTRLADAVLEMTRKRLGCVGVVADGRLVGIITDGDLRRWMTPGRPRPDGGRNHDQPPAHDPGARARGRGGGGDERAAAAGDRAVRRRGRSARGCPAPARLFEGRYRVTRMAALPRRVATVAAALGLLAARNGCGAAAGTTLGADGEAGAALLPHGPKAGQSSGGKPIEIQADRLEVDQDDELATFSGNVDAVQGELSLRAERLRVFYTEQGQQPAGAAAGERAGHTTDRGGGQRGAAAAGRNGGG